MSYPEVVEVFGERAEEIQSRIGKRDHTLWRDDPAEISNRLGWLDIAAEMMEAVPELESMAAEAAGRGITDVVLLGMGGSSLGPEVLRQSFGSATGRPRLTVLDSTVPAVISAVAARVDLPNTLFIVSSKSGGTVEPLSLYRYFRRRLAGVDDPGSHFIAVTDPGTPLQGLAEEQGFWRVFLANSEIGGRYSVLSHFGMVPAALMGIDLHRLLESALLARRGIDAGSAPDRSAAWSLAAGIVGGLRAGRDKLTIATGDVVPGFGLWAEQLLAESTGKQTKGVVPVAGEPLLGPGAYAEDRVFAAPDGEAGTFAALSEAGHPVLPGGATDPYDIGSLFWNWEFATSIVGVELQINPFDQPNVQAAKDATSAVLEEYRRSGSLPPVESVGSLGELLGSAGEGDYLAVMPFVEETDELTGAINELRRRVMEKHQIATTLGYGPRFLHSTGQLHKGGPNSVLAFQVTGGRDADLEIPVSDYTFGTLLDAQAIGDFRSLQATGRRAARLHVEGGVVEAMESLARAV